MTEVDDKRWDIPESLGLRLPSETLVSVLDKRQCATRLWVGIVSEFAYNPCMEPDPVRILLAENSLPVSTMIAGFVRREIDTGFRRMRSVRHVRGVLLLRTTPLCSDVARTFAIRMGLRGDEPAFPARGLAGGC